MPDGNGGSLIKLMVDNGLGYLWFIVVAIWGGTASYLTRLKKSGIKFSIVELLGEWSISGFSGLLTAYICAEMGYSFYITAALAGVAGHMGGRAVFMFEQFFSTKLGVKDKNE